MRNPTLLATAIAMLCTTAAHASGSFIELQTSSVQIVQISPNGKYAAGSVSYTAGFRWTAETGAEELVPTLNSTQGINNAGVLAGSVPENGGSPEGGRDLGAYAAIGEDPVLLTETLQTNSTGYGIADDGTVVGLSFDDGFVGPAVAFVWNAADGMSALPVNRPANYSRANAISADGHVIAGWNDQDDGFRTAVIWQDRVPLDVTDADGIAVGEASAVTADGRFVVGSSYYDAEGNGGAWRWSADDGLVMIPGMPFAFGVSADGKTVVGATGFFDDPPRAAMIWREGIGTMPLADYLAEQGIALPDGWDLSGGLTAISGDAHLLGGWGFGPLGLQSYIVRIDADDAIFRSGFDPE
jgi:uncharacterized membrane protein